jgi:hypothetical protein
MAFTLEDVNEITDEQITPELETALFAKMATRFTTHLTGTGHVVKPKTEYDNDFKTELEKENKKWADSEAPKYYGAMDKMLLAVGLPKPDGMQTRVWVEQLSTEGKLPFTAEQWKKLENALKNDGGGNAQDRALYETLKKEFDTLKESADNGSKEAFKKVATKTTKESLKLAPVAIDGAIKEESKKTEAKKAAIAEIQEFFDFKYEAAEDKDGTLFYQKKGTTDPLMDTASGEPMTALEIMRKFHSNLLAKDGHEQKGLDTKKKDNSDSGSNGKSDADLWAELIGKGMRPHSAEWKTAWAAGKAKS